MELNTANIDSSTFCSKWSFSKSFLILSKFIVIILFFHFLNVHNSLAQKIIIKDIEINQNPTKISIVELRNSYYLTHPELSKLLGLQPNIEGGKLTLSNPNYQLIFLRGSVFFKIAHRKFEEIKQLHLPVIEINRVYHLPFPTILTLLDSANLIKVQIEKKSNVSSKNKQTMGEQQTIVDEIIPQNFEQINSIYNKVKIKLEQKEQSNSNISRKENIRTKPTLIKNEPMTSRKPNPIEYYPPNESKVDKENTELIDLSSNVTKTEKTSIQSASTEIIQHQSREINPSIDTKKMNGYKIPKDVKRKRLQKLLGQNGI